MGKVAQSSVKYVIKAKLESTGLVEKPDVVGAIFGQTEGLLDEEMDLRELQERGRVGRIEVEVYEKDGRSQGMIEIPTSMDATETALLGASLETIERVGPTSADIRVEKIEDERTSKRDYIVKRAKQLLRDMQDDKPEKNKITEEVKEEVRKTELGEFKGFEAGPEAESSEDIILVEGRADVLNLLKHGVKNAVALGGTSIPEKITEVTEGKEVTAFLDGDRGGDLILKELENKVGLKYVTRAPENKEVEEIGKEEIFKALRDRRDIKYDNTEAVDSQEVGEKEVEKFSGYLNELIGTRAVYLLDEDLETKEKVPLNSFNDNISDADDFYAVVFDGEVGKENVTEAEKHGAKYVVGMDKDGYANSSTAKILTREEINELKAELEN